MEQWLTYSLMACFFFACKSINIKIASRTIDSDTSTLLQLPIRVIATVVISFLRNTKSSSPSSSSRSSIISLSEITSLPHLVRSTLTSLPSLTLSLLTSLPSSPALLIGYLFTILSCLSSVLGGFYYGDALDVGGSGSAVAVVAGCNPALGYVLGVLFGLESVNWWKIWGVVLAVGSCGCFAIGNGV